MLAANTRHKLKYRRRPRPGAFPIANRTSIHQRPKEADGKRFGDFEMDLIVDSCNHAILTMTERSTNMLFMTRLKEGKKAKPLARCTFQIEVQKSVIVFQGENMKNTIVLPCDQVG
uniref:IS30 family transposase n=1 Tax=Prevotella sp. GTC17262 TaxID=3236797 RepID=A0AB33JIF6_9BACT